MCVRTKCTDDEKALIMKHAEKAVDASYDVMSRLLRRLKHSG